MSIHDNEVDNAFIETIKSGNSEAVRQMLDDGYVMTEGEDWNAVLVAAETNQPGLIIFLLHRGWDVLWDVGVISRVIDISGFEYAIPLLAAFMQSGVFERFITDPDGFDPSTDTTLATIEDDPDIEDVFQSVYDSASAAPNAAANLRWLQVHGWIRP